MKRVGLTGGIGCGKSTVVAELRKQGISCFVADEVARGYYDEACFLGEVSSVLGCNIVGDDGKADRKAIAAIVFAESEKLAALNSLVHPRVMNDFAHWCAQRENESLVFFESAILYECGYDKLMDAVVAVYLDHAERIRRLVERDHCDSAAIEARMRNQMADEEKAVRADFVILNYEGNPRERQIKTILNQLATSL